MRKKYFLLVTVMGLLMAMSAYGQTNLAGRVYHNTNIMAEEMEEEMKEASQKLENKDKIIADAEKKKGRKLTAAEKAELDKKIAEARKMTESIKKALTTEVTIEFKTEKDVLMKMEMKMDEDALKKAGVGWLKRKTLKAAMAVAPSSHMDTYVVKGRQVIVGKSKDQDIMTLSADGKTLSGKMDDKKITLTRTK